MNTSPTTSPPPEILRRAWRRWLLLTGLSALGMALLLPTADILQINAKAWFIAPILWMLLAVPATIGMYGQYFRDDQLGRAKSPTESEGYLHGVTSVWSVLAAGVAISLGACLLAGSATPGVWPGALMLMLLVLARPASGSSPA